MGKSENAANEKRPGMYYALTMDGLELPVIDITNPAFDPAISRDELEGKINDFTEQQKKQAKIPRLIQWIFLRIYLRNSALAKAIMGIKDKYLGGMHTYMMKLGSGNLVPGFNGKIDRMIADSLPSFAMRLRMAGLARFLADGLYEALKNDEKKPLCFVNIGGGLSPDTLNAMLLLQKEHPGLLSKRKVTITVLDLEEAGPFFGNNALKALQVPGAPLEKVDAVLKYSRYDWKQPEALAGIFGIRVTAGSIVAISSEGGLFEYGDDYTVISNLTALAKLAGRGAVFAGSVTRDEGPIKLLKQTSSVPTVQRNLKDLEKILLGAGWELKNIEQGVFSNNVLLVKT